VSGEVVSAEVVSTKRQRVKVFELLITDKSGMLIGSWFNQPFMKKTFKLRQKVILSGIVKANPYKGGIPQIDNPDYEIMDDDEADNLIHTGRTYLLPDDRRAFRALSPSMMKNILDSCGAAVLGASCRTTS
jgi:RecG-like helicase